MRSNPGRSRHLSQIFLSYAKEDRERARLLAEALESLGWSVWWDRIIPTGRVFDEVIEEELDAARCVIVLWSGSSVGSRWVKAEAESALEQGKLFPALIDRVAIPMAFKQFQAADLVDWDGGTEGEGFRALVSDLRRLLAHPPASVAHVEARVEGRASTAAAPASDSSVPGRGAAARPGRTGLWLGGGILLVLIVLFAVFVRPGYLSGPQRDPATQRVERQPPPPMECVPSLELHWPPHEWADPRSFLEGCRLQVNGVASPGAHSGCPEIAELRWSWGDGEVTREWFPGRHDYSRNGAFELAVTATDEGGRESTAVHEVVLDACREFGGTPRLPAETGPELALSLLFLDEPRPTDQIEVMGGETLRMVVSVREPAPEDLWVELVVPDHAELLQFPEAVRIRRGARQAEFTVETRPVEHPVDLYLEAHLHGVTAGARLILLP